jgi:hypothetical protein
VNQPASWESVSFGVFAGATMPNQLSTSNPGKPDSSKVGTSGSGAIRLSVAAASARSLPAFKCSATTAYPVNTDVTCSPSTAFTAGALPA